MKWYQHESNCHNDEIMRDLIHEFGVEGYGIYHICLELIAEKIDDKTEPTIRISDRVLREKCRVSHQKLSKILSYFDQNSLIFSKLQDGFWILNCPNLLKRLDNWTKRSVVTPKKVSIEGEGKGEVKKEGEVEGKGEAPPRVPCETISLNPKNLLANDLFSGMTQFQKDTICEKYPAEFLLTTLSRYISTAEQRKVFRMNPGTVFTWLERDFQKPAGPVNQSEQRREKLMRDMQEIDYEGESVSGGDGPAF